MTTQDLRELEKQLKKPFPSNRISWRIGQVMEWKTGKVAKLLAYIDARDVMDRLDEVFGIGGWSDSYTKIGDGWVCEISAKIGGEWITKQDGAEETQVEAQKGGISDAFKRAAVKFGVGRFLYEFGETVVDLSEQKPQAKREEIGYHKDRETKKAYYYLYPEVQITDAGCKIVTRKLNG